MSFFLNGFFKKNRRVTDYNYDLEPLINEFSKNGMYALIYSPNVDNIDNGGYLAITEKQYILALNNNYGVDSHMLAAARIYGALTNTTLDRDTAPDATILFEEKVAPIHAKITYECTGSDTNGVAKYSGYIYFQLGDKKYSSKTIEMFLQFYDDYNEEIASICNKYKFTVYFAAYDKDTGKKITNESKNLDNLKEYILSRKDDNIKDYFKENKIEENIIGCAKKENTYKK